MGWEEGKLNFLVKVKYIFVLGKVRGMIAVVVYGCFVLIVYDSWFNVIWINIYVVEFIKIS